MFLWQTSTILCTERARHRLLSNKAFKSAIISIETTEKVSDNDAQQTVSAEGTQTDSESSASSASNESDSTVNSEEAVESGGCAVGSGSDEECEGEDTDESDNRDRTDTNLRLYSRAKQRTSGGRSSTVGKDTGHGVWKRRVAGKNRTPLLSGDRGGVASSKKLLSTESVFVGTLSATGHNPNEAGERVILTKVICFPPSYT